MLLEVFGRLSQLSIFLHFQMLVLLHANMLLITIFLLGLFLFVATTLFMVVKIMNILFNFYMENKRSFSRIWYRIFIDYFPGSSLGFQDECSGSFVSSFGIKTIERFSHNVYPLLPHWCIKVRYEFDYDNFVPISELEYSKRVRGWEDLRALLTKDIIQTTVINLFTNQYHLCLRK